MDCDWMQTRGRGQQIERNGISLTLENEYCRLVIRRGVDNLIKCGWEGVNIVLLILVYDEFV